jgi:dolichol-phosphate mannosyltransferase
LLKQCCAFCKSTKILKFLAVGGSAAVINLALVYALIDISGLDTFLLRNIVNIFAMVISTACAFVLNRRWTWHNIPKRNGNKLIKQYIFYNFITLGGIMIRIILFALLDLLGLYHLFNVAIGISLAAIFNFKMYDKHIFQEENYYGSKRI